MCIKSWASRVVAMLLTTVTKHPVTRVVAVLKGRKDVIIQCKYVYQVPDYLS